MLYKHYHYLVPEHFYHPKEKLHTQWQSLLIPWTPPPLGNYRSTFCIYGFASLEISHKYECPLGSGFFHRASLVAQLVKNLPAMQETWVQSLGCQDPWEGKDYPLQYSRSSLVAQMVRESACNVGDLDSICGLRRSPEMGTATYSSILAWRIPGTVEPGGLPSLGSHRIGHDWAT